MRKAMKRRNYHQVEKEYREVLRRGGAKDTLFDLATAYERLGLYGKEAEVYEEIQKEGLEYPNLNERVRLNKINRKPKTSVNYRYFDKKGRGGYVDMRKESGGVEGWFMPSLSQELHLSYHRNQYSASNGDHRTWSNRFMGSYTSNIANKIDLRFSLGTEDLQGDGEYTLLYDIEFLGRIDDILQGHFSFKQEIVDDTLQAIDSGIHYRDVAVGISFDLLPRWFCGADIHYREYNDENRQNMNQLWTSYNVFGKNDLLRVKYMYEYVNNSRENVGRAGVNSPVFANGDSPYWSPGNYWQHTVGVHFEHRFNLGWSEDQPLSHFDVDYTIGVESADQVTQSADFQIFLEMSRDILLKGNFTYEYNDAYRNNDVTFSIIYRW